MVEDVAGLTTAQRFMYWMRERHQVHLKRARGMPAPWTDDVVLQGNFFTNPYRENDKVTAWFREHVRGPMRGDPGVIFATICFRWFNYIPTGTVLRHYNLLSEWDTAHAIRVLRQQAEAVGKVFTGAFVISNRGYKGPKIDRVCDSHIQPAWVQRHQLANDLLAPGMTMQRAHAIIGRLPGMGGSGFMAYEVICDLRYTYVLENAPDKCTWSNPGPGAQRGLNRLLGRDLGAPCRDYQQESARLLALANRQLGRVMPPLEMREIEHSLCEWDKYERARLGDGQMKRKYNARGACQ